MTPEVKPANSFDLSNLTQSLPPISTSRSIEESEEFPIGSLRNDPDHTISHMPTCNGQDPGKSILGLALPLKDSPTVQKEATHYSDCEEESSLQPQIPTFSRTSDTKFLSPDDRQKLDRLTAPMKALSSKDVISDQEKSSIQSILTNENIMSVLLKEEDVEGLQAYFTLMTKHLNEKAWTKVFEVIQSVIILEGSLLHILKNLTAALELRNTRFLNIFFREVGQKALASLSPDFRNDLEPVIERISKMTEQSDRFVHQLCLSTCHVWKSRRSDDPDCEKRALPHLINSLPPEDVTEELVKQYEEQIRKLCLQECLANSDQQVVADILTLDQAAELFLKKTNHLGTYRYFVLFGKYLDPKEWNQRFEFIRDEVSEWIPRDEHDGKSVLHTILHGMSIANQTVNSPKLLSAFIDVFGIHTAESIDTHPNLEVLNLMNKMLEESLKHLESIKGEGELSRDARLEIPTFSQTSDTKFLSRDDRQKLDKLTTRVKALSSKDVISDQEKSSIQSLLTSENIMSVVLKEEDAAGIEAYFSLLARCVSQRAWMKIFQHLQEKLTPDRPTGHIQEWGECHPSRGTRSLYSNNLSRIIEGAFKAGRKPGNTQFLHIFMQEVGQMALAVVDPSNRADLMPLIKEISTPSIHGRYRDTCYTWENERLANSRIQTEAFPKLINSLPPEDSSKELLQKYAKLTRDLYKKVNPYEDDDEKSLTSTERSIISDILTLSQATKHLFRDSNHWTTCAYFYLLQKYLPPQDWASQLEFIRDEISESTPRKQALGRSILDSILRGMYLASGEHWDSECLEVFMKVFADHAINSLLQFPDKGVLYILQETAKKLRKENRIEPELYQKILSIELS